jgi:phage head maturation protease
MDLLERSGPSPALRAASLPPGAAPQDTSPPTMVGHFAVWNRWTEIDSQLEGHFMERIAPGAFGRTFRENRDRMRVTFQHGKDPALGHQIIASISELAEDGEGAYYEAPLVDGLPPLILNGLRAGLYGSSFRFTLRSEDFNRRASRSDYNPKGLPERTILDAEVVEFGPVTWPQYADATADVRSREWSPARRERALVLLRAR